MEAILDSFKNVSDRSTLRCMKGSGINVMLEDETKDVAINGFRPIPFGDRDQMRKKVYKMVEKGIITPVAEPTEWVSPLVVTRKAQWWRNTLVRCGPYTPQPIRSTPYPPSQDP